MAYNGSTRLASGITQLNGQNYALVDASAVRVDDSTRLDAKLAELDTTIEGQKEMLAPTFDTGTAYHEGDYVLRNGTLYRFKVYHPAGTWQPAHVDEVKAAADIDDIFQLKRISSTSAINAIQSFRDIPVGRYFCPSKTSSDPEDYKPRNKILAMDPNFPFELGTGTYLVSARQVTGNVKVYEVVSGSGMEHYVGYDSSATVTWYDVSVKTLQNMIAPSFDSNTDYHEGDYVRYEGILYRFKVYHSAGTWQSAHVDEVKAATDINDLFGLQRIISTSEIGRIEKFTDIPAGRYISLYTFGGMTAKQRLESWDTGLISFGLPESTYIVTSRAIFGSQNQYEILTPSGNVHYIGFNTDPEPPEVPAIKWIDISPSRVTELEKRTDGLHNFIDGHKTSSSSPNGISFSWDNDSHEILTVNGTVATGIAYVSYVLMGDSSVKDNMRGLEPGKKYTMSFRRINPAAGTKTKFSVYCYQEIGGQYEQIGSAIIFQEEDGYTVFTVPEEAVGVQFRIYVSGTGTVVNGEQLTDIAIREAPTNRQLRDRVEELSDIALDDTLTRTDRAAQAAAAGTAISEVDERSFHYFDTSSYDSSNQFSLADMPDDFSVAYCKAEKFADKPTEDPDLPGDHGVSGSAYIKIVKLRVGKTNALNQQISLLYDTARKELWTGNISVSSGTYTTAWRRQLGWKDRYDLEEDIQELGQMLAPEFDTQTAYHEGDYVLRNGTLYRFKVYHPAGAWQAAHVDTADAAADIDDIFRLKQITSTSAVNAIQAFLDIPSGRYFRAYKEKILAMYPDFPFELSGVGYVVSARKLIDGEQNQYDIISPGGTEHYCGYNQYGTGNIYWYDLSVKSQNVRIQRLEDENPIAFEYYSDFDEVQGLWSSTGTLYSKATENHTQPIPIRGGVNYYTGFIWGTFCMGAWFDKNGNYLAPLIHTATQTFDTETAYNRGAGVMYDGQQYIFTEDHEAGAWNPDQVEEAPDQFTTIPPAYCFHEDWDYSIGRATIYDGKYYMFTEAHTAGPWLGTDVEEIDEAYHPDHAAENGPDITKNKFPITRFMSLYRFTAPENAAFVSLNLTRTLNRNKPPLNPTTPANYEINRYRQYICSRQIFMANGNRNTYSGGNLIIRENDPVYQKTKNLRLCIIGPSTSDINRVKIVGLSKGLEGEEDTELPSFVNPWPEYQQYYNDIANSEDPTVGTNYAWVAKSGFIAGYQEYLKPWFKEVKVFAYSGTAYPYGRGTLNKCSIYTRICGGTELVNEGTRDNPHWVAYTDDPENYDPTQESETVNEVYKVDVPDLSGYDVFFIQGNGNGLGDDTVEGDYTSTNKEQYCGAIRGILDKILTDNPNAVLYLGIMGYQASDHSADPAAQARHDNRKYMSGEIVKLADEYAATVLGMTGRAWFNALPRSFDGSHANNVGNIISGLRHREIMVGI